MEIKDFDINEYNNKKKIVLICYGSTREIADYCLKCHNIKVWRYCDVDVHSPKAEYISIEELVSLEKTGEVIVLICYKYNNLWMLNKLDRLGIKKSYSIRNIFSKRQLRKSLLYDKYQNIIETLDDSFFFEDVFQNKKSVYISSLDATVTSKCTLRCKDCSNLMQYYKSPSNYDINTLIKSIEILLDRITRLNDLRILGGEPFVNGDFIQLINFFKDNEKVNKISVYSNATLFPKENILDCLVTDKTVMVFSDYGVLSRNLKKWMDWCRRSGVGYVVEKMEWWQDCGKLERHDYSYYELIDLYSNCDCRSIPTVINQYLYPCEYVANADRLGAIYEKEAKKDRLYIGQHLDGKEIFDFLYNRHYLEGCRYCNGRNLKRKKIEPHVQSKTALEYEVLKDKEFIEEYENCDDEVNALLSVVIPVFNDEEYLEQSITSVLKQSYKNLEVIIVDDGSTDQSVQLIQDLINEYSSINVRLIKNNHEGVVVARNTGIHYANGEYITFVDADDYVDETYFEKMMRSIKDCDYLRTYFMQVEVQERKLDEHLGGNNITYKICKTFFKEGIFENDSMKMIWKYMFSNPLYALEHRLYSALYKTDKMKSICDKIPSVITNEEDTLYTCIYLSTCDKVNFQAINGYYYRVRPAHGRYDWSACINNMDLFLQTLNDAFTNHKERKLLIEGARNEYYYLIQLFSRHRFNGHVGYKEFVYPYIGRLSGKRIVLYGAGDVGKCYWKNAIVEGECEIVAWVDRNAKAINEREMLPVSDIQDIANVHYDVMIIAVADRRVFESIRKELIEKGIDVNKILWNPTRLVGLIDYFNR